MHEIIWQDRPVGHAEIEKEGLYLKIRCSCAPPDKGFFRVLVDDGIITRDLGICVPEGNCFTLTTRISAKHLKEEDLSFRLIRKDKQISVIPVATEEPFSGLALLDRAKLQVMNGQPEIVIDPIQGPRGSDLILKY